MVGLVLSKIYLLIYIIDNTERAIETMNFLVMKLSLPPLGYKNSPLDLLLKDT